MILSSTDMSPPAISKISLPDNFQNFISHLTKRPEFLLYLFCYYQFHLLLVVEREEEKEAVWLDKLNTRTLFECHYSLEIKNFSLSSSNNNKSRTCKVLRKISEQHLLKNTFKYNWDNLHNSYIILCTGKCLVK